MYSQLFYVASAPFEAARQVKILPQEHRSANLHGHSFVAKIRTEVAPNWSLFPGGEVEQLHKELNSAIAPIDYSFLNDHVEVPTDENMARWIRSKLHLPKISTIGIQSTNDQGADLDEHDHVHIWRRYRFEAAHQLPNVPEGHQCGRMHGHGFEVILHVDQDIGDNNMGVDFDYIDTCWAPYQKQLNYNCLNDIEGLDNPTSEMIAGWLWERIKPNLESLSWITVYETHTSGCHYDGTHYRIWKEQRFESALSLMHAPEGDPRRKLFGHSYMIRLHLTSPLDEIMGWTVDYGDVKEIFKPLYEKLDHCDLTKLNELKDTDVGSILGWVRNEMEVSLPQLDRIDLYETPGCGAVLTWGEHGPALPV